MTDIEKIWLTVVENPRYEVSNYGDLRHKKRKHILKQKLNVWGYYRVCLSDSGLKNGKLWFVHRLVASAFIPNKDNKTQVNHKDGNKLNNLVNNLEWVTAKENIHHAVKIGLIKSGDESHKTIIHKNELVEVCGLRKLGLSYKQIGEIYNVNASTISEIVYSKRYLKDYTKEDFEKKVSDFVNRNRGKYVRKDGRTFSKLGVYSKIIVKKDKEGNIVDEYQSIVEAAKTNRILHTSIVNNLKGRSKTCGGFIYEYKQN